MTLSTMHTFITYIQFFSIWKNIEHAVLSISVLPIYCEHFSMPTNINLKK